MRYLANRPVPSGLARPTDDHVGVCRNSFTVVAVTQRRQTGYGSDTVSTRVGGIYSLKHLMIAHPKQYHLAGMELLCAFIRSPLLPRSSDAEVDNGSLREDVQAAISVIGSRTRETISWKNFPRFTIDLEGVDLAGLKLHGANLSWARLRGATLANAELMNVDLSHAVLDDADLTSARISHSDLSWALLQHALCDRVSFSMCSLVGSYISGAKMTNACLDAINFERATASGTDFSGSQFRPVHCVEQNEDGTQKIWDEHCRIAQRQLDEAIADPDNVPKFDEGMFDPDTSEPLEWNKELCGRRWSASPRDS